MFWEASEPRYSLGDRQPRHIVRTGNLETELNHWSTRSTRLGDWGRVKSVSKDRKLLRVTKRKVAEAADSKNMHYVSAQYLTTNNNF